MCRAVPAAKKGVLPIEKWVWTPLTLLIYDSQHNCMDYGGIIIHEIQLWKPRTAVLYAEVSDTGTGRSYSIPVELSRTSPFHPVLVLYILILIDGP